MDILSSSIDD